MVLNPDVQHKAQDEITQVCDPNQLPSLDDIDSLPYVTAMVLEVLRWSTVLPLGVPTISP
jgi:fumagillin biosynthesis cytochrome P450 monooxygenase